MTWFDAAAWAADFVVNVVTGWDRADEEFVAEPVGVDGLGLCHTSLVDADDTIPALDAWANAGCQESAARFGVCDGDSGKALDKRLVRGPSLNLANRLLWCITLAAILGAADRMASETIIVTVTPRYFCCLCHFACPLCHFSFC